MFINPRKRRVYPDEEREPPTKKKRVDRYIDCSTCNKSVLLASIGLKEFPTQWEFQCFDCISEDVYLEQQSGGTTEE